MDYENNNDDGFGDDDNDENGENATEQYSEWAIHKPSMPYTFYESHR